MNAKDNTRKVITFILVSAAVLLMAYVVVRIPESRPEAIQAVSTWAAMVLVWYFTGKSGS